MAAMVSAGIETLTIPTYRIGPGDLNPPISRRWGYWRIYPYSMLDELSDEKTEEKYRALVLENEHLRLECFTELGGHLYVHDKARSGDVFYRPKVVKPALIALRGAWIAGGIEFNFPVSHNPLTMSPVDNALCENPDGSATIWIGAVELLSRMRWSVGITLRPDCARFETEIRLENCTPLPHRFYFWSNSAERVTMGTRFITTSTTVYGWKGIMRYPTHEGEFVPAYRHHHVACDLFSRNVQGDFFGCYDDETDEGVVHVADHREVNGRKYFTWGNSEDGLYWQHLLGEGDGPYIEVQAGPFETQSVFKMLEPGATMRWKECWYPVAGTGGFEFANRLLALNLRPRDGGSELVLYPTESCIDVTVAITASDTDTLQWEGELTAAKPERIALPDVSPDAPVHVVVSSRRAGVLAEADLPWSGTEDSLTDAEPSAEEKSSPEGIAAEAFELEKAGEPMRAKERYETALRASPRATFPRVRLAVIALWQNLADEASNLLEPVLARFPDDGEAQYYLGLALRSMERREEARDAFARARLSPHFGAMGRMMLGEMASEDGDYATAQDHFQRAAAGLGETSPPTWAQAAMLRGMDLHDVAADCVAEIRGSDPLNPFAAWEHHALGGKRPDDLFGERAETWIEVALAYARLRFYRSALDVLSAARTCCPQAMIDYYRAWLFAGSGRGDEAHEALRAAAGASMEYVFPHRNEAERALRYAISENPDDANAHYLLGTLLYMRGRDDEGRECWQTAHRAGCDEASLFYCMGWTAWTTDRDLDSARKWYERALDLRPDDHRLHADLDAILGELKIEAPERLERLLSVPEDARMRGRLPNRLVELFAAAGRFEEAFELLESHRFHPWEGERGMRKVYVEAYLAYAASCESDGDWHSAAGAYDRALAYPLNVGVGKPFRPADAEIHWRAGLAAEKLGDAEKAVSHFRAAAAEDHHALTSPLRLAVERARWKIGEAAVARENIREIAAALDALDNPTEEDVALRERVREVLADDA